MPPLIKGYFSGKFFLFRMKRTTTNRCSSPCPVKMESLRQDCCALFCLKRFCNCSKEINLTVSWVFLVFWTALVSVRIQIRFLLWSRCGTRELNQSGSWSGFKATKSWILFLYYIFYIYNLHTYIHSITFIQYIYPSPFAGASLHLLITWKLSGKTLQEVPRIELGPALQQADALPTEPRRN